MRYFLLIFLVLLLPSPVFATANSDAKIKVEITPDGNSVNNGQSISVHAKIENIGAKEANFQTWSCSYWDHWGSDSDVASVKGWNCSRNGLKEISLKPGESYEENVDVHIYLVPLFIRETAITFRLGFSPWGLFRSESAYWSNTVKVEVEPSIWPFKPFSLQDIVTSYMINKL